VQAQPAALVVAIDGPSGSGKSTVSRGVATALGLRYLDTGAMYRAATWLALHHSVPLDDGAALTRLVQSEPVEISTDPAPAVVTAAGQDVSLAIRGADVTAAVSQVSAVPEVRAHLVARQREIIGAGGIVVEGRDIGAVVVPDAPVKIFLTADPEVRAQRRAAETADAVESTKESLARRDRLDASRASSPMAQAPDAVVVDATDLTVDQVVARILDEIKAVTA
jgi:cytidylate kinase